MFRIVAVALCCFLLYGVLLCYVEYVVPRSNKVK